MKYIIHDFLENIKRVANNNLAFYMLIVSSILGSFVLGEMHIDNKPYTPIEIIRNTQNTDINESIENNNGLIYASRSGKRYYYANCASNISDKNKVYYNTEEDAKASGKTLASNCVKSQ